MAQEYFHITEAELGQGAKIPILKLGDSGEVFYELALEMVEEIEKNNREGKKTVLICPVGPVGQYPIFVRLVNERRISLHDCTFINMDEYLNEDGSYIDITDSLSFRGFMDREVYSKIDEELVMPKEQRVFPDPKDRERVHKLLEKLGGADICFGGIGINGHLAFNEAQDDLSAEEFAALPTRVLTISRETRAVNAIGDRNGAIDAMPKKAITIGFQDILAARKIRLGVFRDWHRSVIRQAAYGEISGHFPVTLIQNHPDALIITNRNAAQQPF